MRCACSPIPISTSRARNLVSELLEAKVADIDVLEVDIAWPAGLAPHLLDLGPRLETGSDAFFGVAVQVFSVDGQLLAAPWYLGVGRLFYRSDLLAKYGLRVPETWEELAASARLVQDRERAAGNAGIWGYVWQGRAGEDLTVNALEWMVSRGAPPLLTLDGRIQVDDPRAVAALGKAASWVDSITPGAVLEMGGSESLRAFTSGQAMFLRYWSNGLPLAEGPDSAVRGMVAMAELPAGAGPDGRRAAVLGGFGLAVSRHSPRQELAVDLVRWLVSADEQKRRALAGAFDPSRPDLYDDPGLVAARPHFPELRAAFAGATVRPAAIAGRRYDALSQAFANGVHRILEKAVEPDRGAAELADGLRRLGPDRPAARS